MDYNSWALLLPLTIFLLSAIYYLFVNPTSNKKHQIGQPPPSPPNAIPLLGNLAWFRKPLLELSPSLRRLRSELGAPAVTIKFGLMPAIFVIDRALIHEALVHKGSIFGDRLPVGGATTILSSKGHTISSGRGAIWRALRRNLVSELFHPSRVRAFAGARKWVLRRLLADLKEQAAGNGGNVVVFNNSFRQAMFRLFVVMCFGEKVDDATIEDIKRVQLDLLSIEVKITQLDLLPIGKILFWGTWKKFVEIRRRQEEIMIPLITSLRNARHRNQEPGFFSYVDSLIDFELHDDGGGARKLTDDEIVSICSEFFNAGIDTTAVTAEWVMANQVKYPDVQRRLAEEISSAGALASPQSDAKETKTVENDDEAVLQNMPYLKAVILETLRRHPPAPFLLPHAATEDTTLGRGAWAVPKGKYVNFAVAEAGWDSHVWEEPWRFRPERFMDGGEGASVDVTGSREIKMIPFGAGRRICPGMGLAMLHLEYYIFALVREFEWRPQAEGEEIDMSEKLNFLVQMKNPLRARIYPRRQGAATTK